MTYPISDVTRRVVYSGSLGTGPYPFLFEILTSADIGVYKNTTLLTLSADYTVTINADGTGEVNLTSAATSTDTISIFGNKGIQRQTDFTTGGDLFANSLNDELDAQTIFAQQNSEAILRSIRAPVTDPTTIDMVLPSKADRADTVLTFDTDGNPSATSSSAFVAGLSGSILGANYVTNTATGDGSTVNFTVSVAPGAKGNIQIYIDGVYQNKSSFSISGTTITFTEAPPLNASVEFIIGDSLSSTSGNASGIDYDPAGTGAVTTNVQAKLRETVSVKDFGAVGDGVTDDTAAIQAAFDAAYNVFFPEGTYLTGPITMRDGSTAFGGGKASTLKALPFASQTNDVLSLNQYFIFGGDQISNIRIRNLGFEGQNRTIAEKDVHLIFMAGCDNWLIEGCYFTNCGGSPIRSIPNRLPTPNTVSSTDIVVKNNTFQSVGYEDAANGREAIYLNGTQRAIVDGNIIDDTGRQCIALEGSIAEPLAIKYVEITNNIVSNAVTGGIDDESDEGAYVNISNNTIFDCSNGAGIRSAGGKGDKVVSGNMIDGTNFGIKVTASNATNLTSAVVSNNIINDVTTYGIQFNLVKNVSIVGNTLNNIGDEGIIGADGIETVVISNNNINGCGDSGIIVPRASTSLVISNNIVKDSAGVDNSQYGIAVDAASGTTHDNVNISNNIVSGSNHTYSYRLVDILNLSVIGNRATGASSADLSLSNVTTRQIVGNDFETPFTNEIYVEQSTANEPIYRMFSDNTSTNTMQYEFRADGQANSRTGTWGTISDLSLKDNVQYLTDEDMLSQVNDIRAMQFARYQMIGDNNQMLGLIAQDVEKISPNLVSSNSDGIKSIKQSILHQKAVVALQVALNRIDDLENRINDLEN